MKFLCDQMLLKVGIVLRSAGYDTIIVDRFMEDDKILQMAIEKNRYLLTRDKLFIRHPLVIILKSNGVKECLDEINKVLDVNWLKKPFSRCLECNSLLVEIENNRWRCPECNKIFWLGSHTDRMLKTLNYLNDARECT